MSEGPSLVRCLKCLQVHLLSSRLWVLCPRPWVKEFPRALSAAENTDLQGLDPHTL